MSSRGSTLPGDANNGTVLPLGCCGARSRLAEADARLAFALIAAFNMVENEGWTPQVRQVGSGKLAFAVRGSKLEGTGFENEQIGQIHVPIDSGGGR